MSKDELIPAATVMMLRDTDDGPEVFMVVRHHEIDFASGALVFPGGKADPADFDMGLRAYCGSADDYDDKDEYGDDNDDNICIYMHLFFWFIALILLTKPNTSSDGNE